MNEEDVTIDELNEVLAEANDSPEDDDTECGDHSSFEGSILLDFSPHNKISLWQHLSLQQHFIL